MKWIVDKMIFFYVISLEDKLGVVVYICEVRISSWDGRRVVV